MVVKVPIPRKKTWFERAIETEQYHKAEVKKNFKHTMRMTATLLNRSYASVQADLDLADWIRTYPKIVEIKNHVDALSWIRQKKRELRIR